MVDLKIRLEVNEDSESEKIGSIVVDATSKISNCSIKVDDSNRYIGNPSPTFRGQEGLSFARGYLPFNSSGYLANADTQKGVLLSEQNPREFIWGAVDNDGYYDVTITLTKGEGGSNIDKIVIYGDEVANQFPTQAIIDGTKVIYSDDPILRIGFEEASDTHTIRFLKWNRPNYNACIARIMIMMQYYDIDKYTGLKSVESLSECDSETSDVSYGVISSSGSIEILDKDGEIFEMIKDNVISKSNLAVEIFVNENIIQKHITINSKYNPYLKTLSLELSNKLLKLDTITFFSDLSENLLTNISLYDLLVKILKNVYTEQKIIPMLQNNVIYKNNIMTIENYLKQTKLHYVKIDSEKPVRELVEQVCQMAQINMFETDNGDISLISNRPVIDYSENIIKINKKNMFSQLQYDLFNKQFYDRVIIQCNQYNQIENSSIFTSANLKIHTYDQNQVSNNGFTFIANDDGVNPAEYTITHVTQEYIWGLTISFQIDLSKLDKLFTKEELDNMKLKVTETRHNFTTTYSLSNAQITDNGESSFSSISDTGFTIENNILKIQYSSQYRTGQSGGVQNYYAYHSYYLMDITFDVILPHTFSTNLITKDYYDDENSKNSQHYLTLQNSFLSSEDEVLTIIKDNILSDYKNGIANAEVTICCSDLYDLNGDLIIDWENKKQIIKVGDIVKFENDDLYWKVISRKFRKVGAPMLDLKLQEVKLIRS